jgi:hypothetical protein
MKIDRLPAGSRRLRKYRTLSTGVSGAELPDHEHCQDGQPGTDAAEGASAAPAGLRCLDEAKHQSGQPGHGQQRAHAIQPRDIRVRGLGHEADRAGDRDHSEHHVDRERRLQQCPGDQQADERGAAGDRRPPADRSGPRLDTRAADSEQDPLVTEERGPRKHSCCHGSPRLGYATEVQSSRRNPNPA